MIKKCGDEWCVYSSDGEKLLGQHPTEEKAKEQLAAIESSKTHTIKDVEVFSTGTHNGDKYTLDDLKDIVSNTRAMDFLPAIKIGHTSSSDLPAYGYAENPRVDGEKIKVDFTSIPTEVFDAIKEKRFGRVSSEILIGASRNGKRYNKVLGAVALLGQAIPGVAGLKPLYKMFSLDSEKTMCFNTSFNTDLQDGAVKNLSGNLGVTMTDDVKKYAEQVTVLQAQVTELQTFKQQAEAEKAKVTALEKKIFENEVEAKVKELPASVQPFIKALYNFTQPDVKTYAVKLDGKDEQLDMTGTVDKLAGFLTEKFSHLFKKEQDAKGASKVFDSVENEVESKVKEYMEKNKEPSYSKAMSKVFEADADLKVRYASVIQ